MDKRSKFIIGLFVVVILGIIITELFRPRPVNWRPSYTSEARVPLGGFVLFNELKDFFKTSDVQSIKENPFEFLSANDSLLNTDYIFVNDNIYFDEDLVNRLLDYAQNGNHVLIASNSLTNFLTDTLNLQISYFYNISSDSVLMNLANPRIAKRKYHFDRSGDHFYFSELDSASTTVLGTVNYHKGNLLEGFEKAETERINYIKVDIGAGAFFLHTNPEVFSNYNMLNGNAGYAASALSYLKGNFIYWDDYYKSGKIVIDSPLRFILNQQALKWAYYLTLGGILLFVIFRAKREQRIIPVIEPLVNTSIAFAKTVGSLYYQHNDISDLIRKKITYFTTYCRTHYYLDINALNDDVALQLSQKSGRSEEETRKFLAFIKQLKTQSSHTEKELMELHKSIDQFKI